MIDFNNYNIKGMSYNNYNIVRAYGCDGKLIFGEEPAPPPVTSDKLHMYFNDGGNDIAVDCNSSSTITNAEVAIAYYDAGRTSYNGVTDVEFGNCVTEIEHNLLAWTAGTQSVETLSSVTIPSTVTTIGYSFCEGRKALTNIEYPSGVTVIEASSFEHCESLSNFVIKEGVTTIGMEAFAECISYYNITIPSTVTNIGQGAFFVNNGTSTINSNRTITCLATTPPTLGYTAFSFGSMLSASYPIYVPAESLNAYKTAPVWSDYSSRIFAIQ